MHLFMYISEYCGELRDMPQDFNNILNTARKENPVHGITGVLFYDQGKFIQIIEGEKESLETLMHKLKCDHRHKNMKTLIDTAVDRRELADWNMEAFNISSHKGKDWELLTEFRDAYLETFKVSSSQLISWLRHFVNDHDKVKRLLSS